LEAVACDKTYKTLLSRDTQEERRLIVRRRAIRSSWEVPGYSDIMSQCQGEVTRVVLRTDDEHAASACTHPFGSVDLALQRLEEDLDERVAAVEKLRFVNPCPHSDGTALTALAGVGNACHSTSFLGHDVQGLRITRLHREGDGQPTVAQELDVLVVKRHRAEAPEVFSTQANHIQSIYLIGKELSDCITGVNVLQD
jgi:hypothetical protein